MLTCQAQLPARQLDVALTLAEGERVALLGPNGAGKSTTLSVLAGLLRPDSGRGELDGRVLFDLKAGRGRWLPPHARGLALLAQDPLLFPHLTVLENVAFAARSTGSPAPVARQLARSWLAQVGAAQFAGRKPAQLSGGQAQRVAVARALAANPRVLLLDEPLAALDVQAAPVLRQLLRRVLADRAAILVTHDVVDALVLADRVVVLDGGIVVEDGPTAQVLQHPRTPFTAGLAGLNLVRGAAAPRGVRLSDGRVIEGLARIPLRPGEPAVAVFAPSTVSVFPQPPQGSPRNTVAVTITELEPRAEQFRLRASAAGLALNADVTAAAVAELGLYPGSTVYFSLKASAVTIYPA